MNAATSDSRMTPLMFTALVGLKPLAELLIERGADPDRSVFKAHKRRIGLSDDLCT